MRRFDRSSSDGRYSNPCLTMHQPWASLLVHGIKRVEGRSWPSPVTGPSSSFFFPACFESMLLYSSSPSSYLYWIGLDGHTQAGRLWIHAASKVPDPDTIRAMEDFYRQIYAVNGITDINFPDHYPVSRLLGCVQVVGCVTSQELACWEHVPDSVRLEGLTDFCWLCENPQRLVVPFEMRGYQGVYNLERKIHDAAVRGLSPVQAPQPVKFPLPDPRDPFSLNPGSLLTLSDPSKSAGAVQMTASVTAATAGARAAATQFSRKDHNAGAGAASSSTQTQQFRGNRPSSSSSIAARGSPSHLLQNQNHISHGRPSYLQNQNQPPISQDSPSHLLQNQNHQPSISQSTPADSPRRSPRPQNGAPNRLVAVALRELKLSSHSEREGQSPVARSWRRQNS